MARLDKFDLIVLTVVALLVAAAVVVGTTGKSDRQFTRPASSRVQPPPPDPAFEGRLANARTFIGAGQASEAVKDLQALASSNPASSDAHALLGEAYARLMDYPSSMREYRLAISMDPEFLDKKSGKFVGKRVKAAVKDAMDEAKKALAANPDDPKAKAALSDAYYLERMLAGGCE